MTLREFITGELIDIIEWNNDGADAAMAWRFSRPNNEIKNGAQLIVRPAQVAILVDQGTIADVYQPGRHELSTQNMPVLSRLRGWKYGFASPFKADVVFLSTRQFVGLKWGTANPVILRDAELGPVRLRAYGTYALRVVNPEKFVEELSGTTAGFVIDQITDQLRDLIVARVSGVLADGGISVYELAAKYADVASRVQERVAPQFQQYGLSITQFVIENVSLPKEVEATRWGSAPQARRPSLRPSPRRRRSWARTSRRRSRPPRGTTPWAPSGTDPWTRRRSCGRGRSRPRHSSGSRGWGTGRRRCRSPSCRGCSGSRGRALLQARRRRGQPGGVDALGAGRRRLPRPPSTTASRYGQAGHVHGRMRHVVLATREAKSYVGQSRPPTASRARDRHAPAD
jgi:hypothetical protein